MIERERRVVEWLNRIAERLFDADQRLKRLEDRQATTNGHRDLRDTVRARLEALQDE